MLGRLTSGLLKCGYMEISLVDVPRSAGLERLVEIAQEAAVQHQNPVTRLNAALMDAATGPADPYLVINNLLRGVVHMIAARVPLERQKEVAGEAELALSDLFVAWALR
jgi:hypothetical protein